MVVHKGTVLDGIKTVSRLLHGDRPILQVSARCPNLIREMGAYSFMLTGSDLVVEKPDPRVDDHAADALRYLTGSLFGVRGVAVDEPPAPPPVVRPFTAWSREEQLAYLSRQRKIDNERRRRRSV